MEEENTTQRINPLMAKWLRIINYFSFPTVYITQFRHKQSHEPMGVVWSLSKNVGSHMTAVF